MKKISAWKKIAGIAAAGILAASMGMTVPAEESTVVRVGALSGPTAMGMVKLMDQAENGEAQNTYEFADLMTDPSAFVAPLASGEIDIAALPSNLSSVIYNNTEGKVEVLAVGVLGVLNIVERQDDVAAITDLKGKKLYATGQGATPEYTLRYLLTENGLDPDADLEIQWCADTTEALAYVTEDETAIAMLPQPFVTVACAKTEGLHPVLNLSDEWAKLDNGSDIVTGVIVARKAFVEEHPEEVKTFLEEYQASVDYVAEDLEGAAALVEKYGIVGSAAVAQKALPNCSLTCVTGEEMKTVLSGYLNILFEANPKTVGGAMPADDFYYIAE